MSLKKSAQVESKTQGADAALALKLAMRGLWSEHVLWTRDYVVAAVAGLPSAVQSSKRLLRNQDEIGNTLVPYYGKKAGAQLTKLLKEHIQIAVELLDAAKTEKPGKFMGADLRWTVNANEIAAFLSDANPHWPRDDLSDLLALHLKLTKDEIAARLEERWADDVAAFDDIQVEITTLADALADGIVKQFPGKF